MSDDTITRSTDPDERIAGMDCIIDDALWGDLPEWQRNIVQDLGRMSDAATDCLSTLGFFPFVRVNVPPLVVEWEDRERARREAEPEMWEGEAPALANGVRGWPVSHLGEAFEALAEAVYDCEHEPSLETYAERCRYDQAYCEAVALATAASLGAE